MFFLSLFSIDSSFFISSKCMSTWSIALFNRVATHFRLVLASKILRPFY